MPTSAVSVSGRLARGRATTVLDGDFADPVRGAVANADALLGDPTSTTRNGIGMSGDGHGWHPSWRENGGWRVQFMIARLCNSTGSTIVTSSARQLIASSLRRCDCGPPTR